MLILYLVYTYLTMNLVLGLAFHFSALLDAPAKPKIMEVLVFFAVFFLLGLPATLVALLIPFFSPRSRPNVQSF